jgi:hypothetical protein
VVAAAVEVGGIGLRAIGLEPAQLLHHVTVVVDAGLEVGRPQRRMRLAERDQAAGEGLVVLLARRARPVQPVRRPVKAALWFGMGTSAADHALHCGIGV